MKAGVKATQHFKRNLLLNLYREGKKYRQFISSCRLREIKMPGTYSYFLHFETPGLPACYPLNSKQLRNYHFFIWLDGFLKNNLVSNKIYTGSLSVMSHPLRPHEEFMDSPGQSTGVGSLSLLPGIFPTQRSNPGLLHYRQVLYQLSHIGSPK